MNKPTSIYLDLIRFAAASIIATGQLHGWSALAALTPGLPADWQLLVIDNGTGSGGPIF